MQRLAQTDLCNHLLENEKDEWKLINFPAYDEETNTVLNPVTNSIKSMQLLKEVDPETYWAQYQQQPAAVGGTIINPAWWQVTDLDHATRLRGFVFITADTAFKSKKGTDFSVLRCWKGTERTLVAMDADWGRWEFPELIAHSVTFSTMCIRKYGASEFWVEDRASGTPLVQALTDAGVDCQPWLPTQFMFPIDKASRMRASAFPVHAGCCYLIEGDKKFVYQPRTKNQDEKFHLLNEQSYVLANEATRFSPDMTHAHDDHCDTFTMAISLWLHGGGQLYSIESRKAYLNALKDGKVREVQGLEEVNAA